MFKKYSFEATKIGKHILILGAVHGNEVAGTIAQHKLIELLESDKIKLKSGKIIFIPKVNVEAQKIDARFVDVNLNRVVCHHSNPSNNEERIANQLIKEIDDCDIMLDLHSTHCKNDRPFAFIDYPNKKNLELLSLIPVNDALAGWPEIYENQPISDFCTERYANWQGKTGITVECGYHKSEDAADIAVRSIINVLSFFEVIEEKWQQFSPNVVKLHSVILKKYEGKMSFNYSHLTPIRKGDIIAVYDNGEKEISPIDGYIIMPNHGAVVNSEWFYYGCS